MQKTIFLFFLLLINLANHAQVNNLFAKDSAYIHKLEQDFITATKEHFQFINADIKTHFGDDYWVAAVKPKDTGIFVFQYQFENKPSNNSEKSDFSGSNIEMRIRVLKEPAQSAFPDLSATTILSDDILLIPIKINKNYVKHIFEKTTKSNSDLSNSDLFSSVAWKNTSRKNLPFIDWNDNTLGPELSFYLSDSTYIDVANPQMHILIYNVYRYLFFKANNTGKVSLDIYSHTFLTNKSPRYNLNDNPLYNFNMAHLNYSIIIVDHNQPIYRLIESEKETIYDEGKYFNYKTNYYKNSLRVVKKGDVFTLPVLFGHTQMGLEEYLADVFKKDPFSITKNKFWIDDYFSSWITEKYK